MDYDATARNFESGICIVSIAHLVVVDDGVCFEGIVDDHIAEQIRKKAFKGISIELDWLRLGGSVEYVNGVAAKNFELTSLHLLHRFPSGDPDAFVKLWEQMRE